jgi:hypothetical protein
LLPFIRFNKSDILYNHHPENHAYIKSDNMIPGPNPSQLRHLRHGRSLQICLEAVPWGPVGSRLAGCEGEWLVDDRGKSMEQFNGPYKLMDG